MLDDIIDDVEPWCLLAGFLKEQGAQTVYAMAPHGILSGNALEQVDSSASLDQVVITNTGQFKMVPKVFSPILVVYPFEQIL